MNPNPGKCAASNLEIPCGEPPTMTEPVLLCDEHKVQVAALVVPGLLNSLLADVRAAHEGSSRAISPANAHMIASAQSSGFPEGDQHIASAIANGSSSALRSSASSPARAP